VYVADSYNHRIRKINPNGDVITIAGSGVQGYADGEGTRAKFNYPESVVIDNEDNLFISDCYNNRIRKLSKQGMVSTIAGSSRGYEDGVGTNAKFSRPTQIELDSNNNILIADAFNHRIRKITPHGVVSTIAGSGVSGIKNGDASSAQFSHPRGIGLDQQGNLYVTDSSNHQIRKITCSGVVSTLAGSARGYKDGIGSQAQFDYPFGIMIDKEGNLLVADSNNHRIRKVTPQGVVSTVAGSNKGHVDGASTSALFNFPSDIALDSKGRMVVADRGNNAIRLIS